MIRFIQHERLPEGPEKVDTEKRLAGRDVDQAFPYFIA